jgi:hypothetical protein
VTSELTPASMPPAPQLTLGARLDVLGRELADRHLTELPWAAPLRRAMERADELSAPHSDRFTRHEAPRPEAPRAPRMHEALVPARDLATGLRGGAARRHSPGPDEAGHRAHSLAPVAGGDREQTRTGVGRRLPADVRTALRAIAGSGADTMLVHDGPESDAIARRNRSDAVTIGRDVHLRSGRLAPDTAEGFGLLAHEAAHVTAGLTGGVHHRGHSHGRALEEDDALLREAVARQAFGSTRRPRLVPAATGTLTTPVPSHPGHALAEDHAVAPLAAHAMTAGTDRSVGEGTTAHVDLDQLRRSVIGDVMRQLRSEFERGA